MRIEPDTIVFDCWYGALIDEDGNMSPCADCQWWGPWSEANAWVRSRVLTEYADELEFPDE